MANRLHIEGNITRAIQAHGIADDAERKVLARALRLARELAKIQDSPKAERDAAAKACLAALRQLTGTMLGPAGERVTIPLAPRTWTLPEIKDDDEPK